MTSAAAALLGVGEWLDTIGLSEYKDVFEEEGYDDIAVVSELTEADLDVLRITKRGTRKKLLMKAKALKATIITKGTSCVKPLGGQTKFFKFSQTISFGVYCSKFITWGASCVGVVDLPTSCSNI